MYLFMCFDQKNISVHEIYVYFMYKSYIERNNSACSLFGFPNWKDCQGGRRKRERKGSREREKER